ncbi:hypothetical protein [Tenuibacillus multivorans]|uniref:Ribosomal-protein-alanine N-acetyltransferase n=1 Tax=Tenuibacillus multivorans TaxID=237069 RepID=A0A1H0DW56_9BACI|nr:hypothetical protein [Tenuibacillus multivorans]GEL76761.1 hypothetical protein TMU01_09960 [Tenuibacillus multivorans]SDN74231.1 hypothetical protein SAMN05216498_2960 [Tenuibacillus multivorans]
MSLHLESERLCYRPFTMEDAPRIKELSGDRDISKTTLNIP